MTSDANERIGRFYGFLTSLEGILAVLAKEGVDTGRMRPADLATRGLDCQNLGGLALLEEIVSAVAEIAAPGAGERVLDVGCGIGGPGRVLAERFGCRVLGVDVVPARVGVARDLTERCGLAGRIEYRVADATALPAPDAAFAQAWMLDASVHVRDKRRLFAELARVVAPAGLLVLHDQMGPLPPAMRPLRRQAPWHAPPLAALIRRLEAAGFRLLRWRDTTPRVLAYFQDLDRLVSREGREGGDLFALLDAYLATLGGQGGRTGLLIARRLAREPIAISRRPRLRAAPRSRPT
jgi:SAM-dependent methyltransferase